MNEPDTFQNRSEKEIFFEALEKNTPEERAAFLDGACGRDPALRSRVEALLANHFQQDAFMKKLAVEGQRSTIKVVPVEEVAGTVIGRYKLLQQIGEGGCGIVYMAEQEQPVRRRVALKVIKLGMDTKGVIARFEAERQALAMMDHPNIAKVLDAGATEAGRPFFVMELVRGIKITDYCDQNNVSTNDRLNLFAQICRAVQHAHQKGIIHRDIKPSNILVTMNDGVPMPKVIDFGIAKATQGRLTDHTLFTAYEQFIGTPAYMSPEQAEMSAMDIDTRSDIYSLGVLLYELLTGKTPFDSKDLLEAGLDEMRRTIREKEPARPSTRLSTMLAADLTSTAKHRQTEAPKLLNFIRGDLDWIVMKCLEKDRTRRYETANGLAADIHRHLNNELVTASPPSQLYRFQKFVRRNKATFAAGAAIAATLVIGLIVSTWLFTRERSARRQATAARNEQSQLRALAQSAQESEAKEKVVALRRLYDSLLGQARATTLARRAGFREKVFNLIGQARDLHTSQADIGDLRREAVGAMGDFVGLLPTTFTDFPTNEDISRPILDPARKLAAFVFPENVIQLREIPSGKEVARLTAPEHMRNLKFNGMGNKLFAITMPATGKPAEMSAGIRLYSWVRQADGRWQKGENSPLPGSVWLFGSTNGVIAPTVDSASLPEDPTANGAVAIKLLNIETRRFIPGVELGWVNGAAINRDGQFFALQTVDGVDHSKKFLEIWDLKKGRRINRAETHLGPQAFLSFSPDGKYLSYLSEAGGAILTVPDMQHVADLKESYNTYAAFANDMIALPVYHQNRIRLWSLVTKEDIAYVDEPEHVDPLAFAEDGSFLMTWGNRPWFYWFNTAEKLVLKPHAAAVTGVEFSPDGTRIASIGKERAVRVCDSATGARIWETDGLPGPGQCVSYDPSGEYLVTGDYETDLILIWDANTGKRLAEIGTGQPGATMSARFSPDGRHLVAADGAGIKSWTIERRKNGELQSNSAPNGAVSITETNGDSLVFSPDPRRVAFTNNVNCESLVFSPDGKQFAFEGITSDECNMYLWDFDSKSPHARAVASISYGVQSVSFRKDGHKLLFMNTNKDIAMLDALSQKTTSLLLMGNPKEAQPAVRNLCVSSDGTKLAVDSPSILGVQIWNLETGKLLYSLPEDKGTVYWLAWSPDSLRLAVGRDNGETAVWSLTEIDRILAGLNLNL